MTVVHEISVRDALISGSKELSNSESPWLDACLLLAQKLDWTKEKLLASYPDFLDETVYADFMTLILKRKQGFPVAYITGKKEFYGHDFYVEEGILCPRPDTEILIEQALQQIKLQGYKKVHDLCTGSGCIALTLFLQKPHLIVSASDISDISERIFKKNREALQIESVSFKKMSLFNEMEFPVDLIVTNPPYLTTEETSQRLNQQWREPALALDGGWDGLDLIRIIIREAPTHLRKQGMLMIEADPRQMDLIERLLENKGFVSIKRVCDLVGDERVIMGNKI